MKQKETRKTARWDVWLLVCVLLVPAAYADITPDGSLGTLVNQVGSDFDISGGTRWDANLFHSFGVFDLNTGESATFQGPADVMRILGRVTGGSASNLDGTLRSGISGADLYLINPAGIVFGPNASLEVSGSFHVTTADYLRLGNDGRFDAAMPANSVLTAAAPSAFGFVSAAPQPIEINGSFLRTGDFSTLSVIGGDIILADATLHAKEGRINMASVAEAGEVRPLAAGLDTGSFSSLGDIRITHSTDIDGRPTGDNFGLPLGNVDVSGDGAGDVYIRSGNFYSDNGQVFSDTQGGGAAGSIDVNVSDELKMVNEGRLIADAFFFGGAGSDISVDAGHVVLESGSTISTLTGGTGDAGNVVVNASDSISASGRSSDSDPRLLGNARSGIASETAGPGAGGIVEINTPVLVLSDEATLSTESLLGPGGELRVNAGSVTITDRAAITLAAFRAGNAGSLILNADELAITSGGAIDTRSRGGGDAGNIYINVGGDMLVSGTLAQSSPSGPVLNTLIASNSFAEGNGGVIEINAGRLVLGDQAVIQANIADQPLRGQPGVAPDTHAGSVTINADSMEINGGAQIISGNDSAGLGGEISVAVTDTLLLTGSAADGSQTSGLFNVAVNDGAAGSLHVSAGDLRIEDGATINTSSIAAGNAGRIQIDATAVTMSGGAVVSSSTSGSGPGGEVRVNASDSITASGTSATGFATGFYSDVEIAAGSNAAAASGDGGSIHLSGPVISLQDGATVSAKSTGTGNAGNINIDSLYEVRLVNGASVTTASSISGGGRINVNVGDMLYLRGSEITSSVADGSGNGGDIVIDPVFVILDSSRILANADAGNGGNISITTQHFIASSDSVVDASANTGIDGQVNISSPDADLSGALADLPESFLNVVALLKQRCAARSGSAQSSFVVAGAGGVPATPDGLLYASVPGAGAREPGMAAPKAMPVIAKIDAGGAPALLLGCGGG